MSGVIRAAAPLARMPDRRGYILIVTKSRDDAFTALFFGGLPPDLRQRLRILEFGRESLRDALAGAAAVIVMRHGLFSFGSLSGCAGLLRVPRYYFLDDNLLLLHQEPEVYGPYWDRYTDDNVRRALAGYQGVLLASEALAAYFRERRLHERLILFPPIAVPVLRPRERRRPGDPFRVAFFGGEHRRDLLVEIVHPALRRLAEVRPVELVAAGIGAERFPPAPRLTVASVPYDTSYQRALAALALRRIDALVHPTPPSRNNPYKNANVVINARAIGAVAVLSHVPPYDAFGASPPALVCENDAGAWYEALRTLEAESAAGDAIFARAVRYCETAFSGASNAGAIAGMLDAHAPPGRLAAAARRIVSALPLGADRLNQAARRAVRSRLP
ncbi:MAG: hypothetical protein IT176_14810 [Acidobacteria bacterium]|nr:hypothetical protein [Acidobacteriota bacterium]